MHKVIDTNIFLLDATNLVTLGKDGSIVVIPETVLDEIDSKKSGFSEIAFQARAFGRLLAKAEDVSMETVEDLTINELSLEGSMIHIVSSSTYPSYEAAPDNIINDRKIIEIAVQYNNIGKTPTFITNDIACKHRAKSLGLNVQELRQVEGIDTEFVKLVQLSNEQFGNLHKKNILDIYPEHKTNTFNYKFLNTSTGQVKLATVSSSIIDVIGKETEKELRRQDVNPANSEQLFFSKALQDTSIDINIAEAKAGSGKTVLAVSNGIKLIKKGHYSSLIYIRASVDDVDKAEEVGFLAGNDEKVQVYLHPLEDTLDFIVRSRLKSAKEKGEQLEERIANEIVKLKASCNIEPMIGLGLRGRTFHDAYVIIDEAQNQSKASLQKTLTRFGKNCKIVVIGSNKQIDNAFINKYNNGLSVLLDSCSKEHDNVNLHAVSLPKVMRGPIAEFAENIFSGES